jgi:hypothetical protein
MSAISLRRPILMRMPASNKKAIARTATSAADHVARESFQWRIIAHRRDGRCDVNHSIGRRLHHSKNRPPMFGSGQKR